MESSQIYILVSIFILLILAIFAVFFIKNKKETRITPIAGLSFAFIIAGIFVDDRLISYFLIGVGVLFALIDIIRKNKK